MKEEKITYIPKHLPFSQHTWYLLWQPRTSNNRSRQSLVAWLLLILPWWSHESLRDAFWCWRSLQLDSSRKNRLPPRSIALYSRKWCIENAKNQHKRKPDDMSFSLYLGKNPIPTSIFTYLTLQEPFLQPKGHARSLLRLRPINICRHKVCTMRYVCWLFPADLFQLEGWDCHILHLWKYHLKIMHCVFMNSTTSFHDH